MNLPKSILRLLLGRRLPTIDGTLAVDGCRQPVRIRRDAYGVPYIEAQNDEDAWYGLGFCVGQDRAFQLETLLRVARGTLAALVGPDALPADRFSRRIGFHRTAEAQWSVLDDEVRAVAEAYARGINDGVRVGCRRRAHEFVLLGAQPTPFTVVDVLGVFRLIAFDLASNWPIALARLKILSEDGEDALRALDAAYPAEWPVSSPPHTPAGGAIDRLAQDLALFSDIVKAGGASNNWAVASSRSAAGRPILANDTHLAPVLPCQWYLAHVRTPEWGLAGTAFVGGPAIPAGHNGYAAWGATAGMVDNTDLFVEEIGPDGRSVRQGNRWVPCEVRREVIEIKGQDPVVEEVLITPHGPIISPALEGEWSAISISATWLAPRPLVGLLGLHRVRSFGDFRRCMAQWPGASLGMVYADVSDTIGWQLIGDAPRRRKGWGVLPAAGWDPEVGWEQEPVPFAEMPYLANPEIGFVVAANAKPACDDGVHPFLGVDWLDGCRLARIDEVLAARHDWDLDATQALQMDRLAASWRTYRDRVLAAPVAKDQPHARQGLDVLARWDGVLRADSAAATIYVFLRSEMIRRIARAKAPHTAEWALGKSATVLSGHSFWVMNWERQLASLLVEQPAGWFARGWGAEIADALEKSVGTIVDRYGADPTGWGWGSVRTLTLQHAVGGRPPLDRIFNLGPFPWGGDETTVSAASVDPLDPTANPHGIASMRVVVDLGNWEASRFIVTHGQSGNPLSPHYDDQLPLWQRGEGIPIAWSPEQVDQVVQSELRLLPRQ